MAAMISVLLIVLGSLWLLSGMLAVAACRAASVADAR